jgi:hypothetical protein
MLLILLILQAGSQPLPDISLQANVRARSVEIERKGEARLTVTAEPEGGSIVDIQAPKAEGRTQLRNLDIRIKAEARLANPETATNNAEGAETPAPQSR